jgi:hypothetical protein
MLRLALASLVIASTLSSNICAMCLYPSLRHKRSGAIPLLYVFVLRKGESKVRNCFVVVVALLYVCLLLVFLQNLPA